MSQEPTDEGKLRHPPDGLYEEMPCTCTPECKSDCRGECGCSACASAYGDQLDCDY